MRLLRTTGDLCLNARQIQSGLARLALVSFLACLGQVTRAQAPDTKRRITVKDTIEMTEFADRGYFLGGEPSSPVAIFSPNGRQFLIRLKKGNVERNVVEYSLLLFQTSEAFQSLHTPGPVANESASVSAYSTSRSTGSPSSASQCRRQARCARPS